MPCLRAPALISPEVANSPCAGEDAWVWWRLGALFKYGLQGNQRESRKTIIFGSHPPYNPYLSSSSSASVSSSTQDVFVFQRVTPKKMWGTPEGLPSPIGGSYFCLPSQAAPKKALAAKCQPLIVNVLLKKSFDDNQSHIQLGICQMAAFLWIPPK